MKSLKTSVVLSFISAFLAPLFVAQSASAAQVLSEDPDGAVVIRSGSAVAVNTGDILKEGDVLQTNNATVIVSVCDGALVTLYPGTEIVLANLSAAVAQLTMNSGELLGDSVGGCSVSVNSIVGTTNINSGVFGILLSTSGGASTLQVRNLDGNVTFTGGSGMDTSNLTAAIVGAGRSVSIPAGEEVTIRGTYDAGTGVFAILSGGAVMATMSDSTVNEMRQGAQQMGQAGAEGGAPEVQIIEIPIRDVETASEIR